MNTALKRRDPAALDALKRRSGKSLWDSIRNAKSGAHAAGVTPQLMRRWLAGADSPVSRFLELLASLGITGANPYPLVVAAKVTAMESQMHMESDAACVTRFRELVDAETSAGANTAQAKQRVAWGGDISGLEAALVEHAAIIEELIVGCRQLRRRNLHPTELPRMV